MKKLLCALTLIFASLNVHAQIPNGSVQNYTTSQGAKWQQKPVRDARDLGVDCSFATDSAPALNALTGNAPTSNNAINGWTIMFPTGCRIKLASTWTIKNQSAFTIKGPGKVGNNGIFSAPTFTWCGAQDGTIIDMEYTDGFKIEGVVIDGGSSGCPNKAAIGINVDKTGAGGIVNTTDGEFNNMFFSAAAQGGAVNVNWVGLQLSAVSSSNVEDMRLTNSTFFCGGSPTSGKAAINIGSSFNVKNIKIEHNFIHDCANGVLQTQGASHIRYNEFGSNHIDIHLSYWADPQDVIGNLSESAESGDSFLLIDGAVGHGVEISGNNIPLNDTCAITFNGGGPATTFYSSWGNTFYNGFGSGAGSHRFCDLAAHGATWVVGPGWAHNTGTNDWSYLIGQNPSNHNVIDTIGLTTFYNSYMQSTGSRFTEKALFYFTNDTVLGLSPLPAHVTSTTSCGLNSLCRNEGEEEITGVTTPDGLLCANHGGGTGGTRSWKISAVDSAGNETMVRANPDTLNAASCFAAPGNGEFDGSHYVTLTWVASPNASSYNLYANNPADPGGHMASVATGVACCTYQFNGPNWPASYTLDYTNSPYNKTLSHILRGKEVDFNYGTPLKGYSDNGSTAKWNIATSTGNATFNQVTSTVTTGTAPLVVASTTNVPNLNASSLGGATFASPGAIGGTVPGAGNFTTVTASSTITGTNFISTSNAWTAGTIAATGNVVCPSGTTTASDCATSASNQVGVAPATSGTINLIVSGYATLNYDGTVSPSAGWNACMSAITVGKVLVQAAACPGGQVRIGIVAAAGVNVTSGQVWLTLFGGGTGGGGGGTGTVTNVAVSAPLAGGPITTTGTLTCPTCAIGPGSSTAGHAATFASADGVTLADGGVAGTVTNVSGPLTVGAAIIGNGGNDVQTGIISGNSTDGVFTKPVSITLSAGGTTPLTLSATNSADTALNIPFGHGNIVFNRLVTTSATTATGGSIIFGPTDAIIYGCASCSVSPITGSATSQNLLRGNGSAGPVKLGDYQGWSTPGLTSGVISFLPQAVAGTYNWNWPTTAGAIGQCLLSGGGGSTPETWGTCGGGGGGGSVTHTLGPLTANAIMLGNNADDSKVLTTITTNGNGEIDLGLNGTVSGGVKLLGSTSGSATIQAAPAAGTPNAIYLPLVTGAANGLLSTNGANPQQTSWTLTPTLTSLTATTVNSTNGALNGTLGATTPSTIVATTIVAQGVTASGPPGIATGTASNTDLAGQLTLSGGTITYTFVGTYVSAPICVATDVTAKNATQVSATTTVLTINGTTSDVVNYICVGRN